MLLSCLTFLLAGLPLPLPPAVPPVLLDAPVNATWCANHAEYWAALGFAGFLFPGIAGLNNTEDEDRDSHLIHRNDPLLREIGLAQRRLAAAGIGRNFLSIKVDGNAAWFSDQRISRAAEQRFRRAGAFARDAGLQGIAIDTAGQDPLYDHRWEAYAINERGVRAARAAARDFGRRCLRAVIREFGDAAIVVLVDDLAEAGPLWFELFAGFVDAAGGADTVELQLAIGTAAAASHTTLRAALDVAHAEIEARLDTPALRNAWRAQGGIAPRLRPVEGSRENMTPRRFRELLVAAKTAATRYVICSADNGGWRAVAPEEAAEYRVLHQQGAGAVHAADAVAGVERYTLRSPIDAWTRAGTATGYGPGDFVFAGPDHAAVLLWEGLAEPMTVNTRRGLLRAVFLEDGSDTYFTPRDGRAEIPALPGPVVLSGLPLADWAVPAGMRFDVLQPIAAGTSQTPVRLGVANPTPAKFAGVLNVDLGPGASIGAASFPLRLDAGETRTFNRNLRGTFTPGQPVALSLNLISDTGAVFQRGFRIEAEAPWKVLDRRDGAIVGLPAIADLDRDGDMEIVITTARGEVAAYSASGKRLWERRYRTGFVSPPVVVQMPPARFYMVASDDERRVWIMDRSGEYFRRIPVPGDVAGAAVCMPLSDELLTLLFAVPLRDGRVTAVSNRGDVAWVVPVFSGEAESIPQLLGVEDHGTPLLYAFSVNGNAREIVRLGVDGSTLWRQSLDAPLSAAPVFAASPSAARLAAPLRSGGIQFLDAWTGASEYLLDPGDGHAAHALAVLPAKEGETPELLAVYDDSWRRLTLEGDLRAEARMGLSHKFHLDLLATDTHIIIVEGGIVQLGPQYPSDMRASTARPVLAALGKSINLVFVQGCELSVSSR